MKKNLLAIAAVALTAMSASAARQFTNDQNEADVVEREIPADWDNFIPGGQFIDRFETMPEGELRSDVWGCEGVIPRYVDNGIECAELSFWGGNIMIGDDGLYHLFVCGWDEKNPRGFRYWSKSTLYHTVSESSIGPYEIKDSIGYLHNPDTYRLKDGSYVTVGFSQATGTREYGYYIAPTINGPWEYHVAEFLPRDRKISVTANLSFLEREDGSVIAVGKDGKMWISQNGRSPYSLITQNSAYPDIPGYMEDPDIWHDGVQYHLVFNDAKGRIAYYMRSKDCVNWIWEEGVAYRPGLLTVHKDGIVEDWHKYERIKILQDSHGRAVQANFGVLDVHKDMDKSSDNHSSKNISIPMNPGMLVEWAGSEKKMPKGALTPKVRIIAEEGFDPINDIDLSTLRLGEAKCVNMGGGSKVLSTEVDGADLIVTFSAEGHNISADEFAPKLLGRTKNDGMIYGYTRLPWVDYEVAILSSLRPAITPTGSSVTVENWGVCSSKRAELRLMDSDGNLLESSEIKPIKPYGSTKVALKTKLNEKDKYITEIYLGGEMVSRYVGGTVATE